MNASGDDPDIPSGIHPSRWRQFSEEEKRTIKQRRRIYEEEKRSIELSAPAVMFSKRTKIVAGVYLLGCVLIYFGIPQSVLDFCGTRQWKYQPETDIFRSLGNAALELIRPFIAVVVCGWAVAIPPLLVWGLWSYGEDIVRFFRRLFHREPE